MATYISKEHEHLTRMNINTELSSLHLKLCLLQEDKKSYFRHTGYPGGVKTTALSHLRRTYPERIIENAVKGMLPHNKLGRRMLNHLKVYAGPNHPHIAQAPKVLEI